MSAFRMRLPKKSSDGTTSQDEVEVQSLLSEDGNEAKKAPLGLSAKLSSFLSSSDDNDDTTATDGKGENKHDDEISSRDLIPAALVIFTLAILFILGEQNDLAEDIVTASIRTAIQLSCLGFVLTPFFRTRRPILVLAYVGCFMLPLAAYETSARTNRTYPHAFQNAFLGMTSGVATMAAVAIYGVVRPNPRHSPRHVIPLAGMLVNNALSGTALSVGVLLDELSTSRRVHVESMLSFGAGAWEAAYPALARAVGHALVPQLNSMNVIGLVSIPGMMTGQVLGGATPGRAARYQIMIMYLILGGTATSSAVTCALAVKDLFNERGVFLGEVVTENSSPRISHLFSSNWFSSTSVSSEMEMVDEEDSSFYRHIELRAESSAPASSSNAPLLEVEASGTFPNGSGEYHASFSANVGDVVVIMGASGTGKSTLMRSVAELSNGSDGTKKPAASIKLDSRDRSTYSPSEWRGRVLFVPQGGTANALPGTPNNLIDDVSRLRIRASTSSGKKDGINPPDLNVLYSYLRQWGPPPETTLGRPWAELSGGEAQRVLLAIALSTNPSVLLLDEPTSGLDETSKRRVEQTISSLENCAVVLVTHDEDQAARMGASRWRLVDLNAKGQG
mmetsp:Transcript_25590/g.33912  ORF Transcript_25590/g.33912 Transcript_25590/m.33912 type:complete len:619 (-) Transcript_25590:88-1944(-)